MLRDVDDDENEYEGCQMRLLYWGGGTGTAQAMLGEVNLLVTRTNQNVVNANVGKEIMEQEHIYIYIHILLE